MSVYPDGVVLYLYGVDSRISSSRDTDLVLNGVVDVGDGKGEMCQDRSVRDRKGCRWRWKMTRGDRCSHPFSSRRRVVEEVVE